MGAKLETTTIDATNLTDVFPMLTSVWDFLVDDLLVEGYVDWLIV